MVDSSPQEEEVLPEQEPDLPSEPDNILNQEGIFDEYNLPVKEDAPTIEESIQEAPYDPSI